LDGWKLTKQWAEVPSPQQGDRWKLDVPLELQNEGFEYSMAVGMEVKEAGRALWFPSILTTRRRVQLVQEKDGQYVPGEAHVVDAPAISDVAISPLVAVPNNREPRAPEVLGPTAASSGYHVRRARPILAPPGIPRDPLLTKLLASSWVSEGTPTKAEPWA